LTAPISQPSTSQDTLPLVTSVSVGAAIDIGSNSVHLLVALVGPGWVEPLRDTSELLGLGDVVDRDKEIPAQERSRVIEVVREFQETARRSHAERVIVLGTEPLRRARNADELVSEMLAETALKLWVLSQRQEAQLTFVGATHGELPDRPLLVADIGGGSTEALTFIPGRGMFVDHIPLGSARLTNSIVEHDPPTDEEVGRLFAAASNATAELAYRGPIDTGKQGRDGLRAVFVGGTATNVARLGRLTRTAMAEDRQTLERMNVAAIAAKFNVKPRRARQLAAGVAIVAQLLERYGLDSADVSDASLRDGAIIAAARFGDRWPDALEEMF
jgi:exopolyphosphatase/pppGpp-phosphohydrolase